MKKITLLILMLLAFDFGFGQVNDLIISEYAEGSSNNKYIEIFNGTSADVDLSDYEIRRITNGGPTTGTVSLSGTLSNGNTYVIANGSANATILAEADLTSGVINMTGDDSISLRKDDGTGTYNEIDIIGVLGVDPGSGWDVAGIPNATSEHTLVRKASICSTNTNWATSAGTNTTDSEWIVLPQDDWSEIGSHATDCCIYSTTWTAGAWFPSSPTINTIVTIDDDYNTGNGGTQISFRACSLIVNTGVTLTIADNTYIEVQNDLTVDGTINVNPNGSFVQNDDLSNITYNGTIQVYKRTAPMNAWYEYTYWSSPVENETIDALAETNPNRRFVFNAENFLDATAETGNNNIPVTGQDDIDDNGNDWQRVGGSEIMQPGVGYAATLTVAAYNFAPGVSNKEITLSPFVGRFNNGEYTVPVYRNDSEGADNNWNIIGNPYPSAIDVDLFLAANTEIDETDTFPARSIVGAIYLWSQNTAPSATTNGNEGQNFSNSDYAIINGVTELAGGDLITPDRFIPSGQAFLVSYSDLATPISTTGDIAQGEITFNNSMRVAGNNDLFFKKTQQKNATNLDNKLHINLTSDNGIYNQIAVGYVNGATNANDGSFYDAPKNAASGAPTSLYTTIVGSNKKFAIQGKAKNSLNADEIISLGFSNAISVPTIFTLSIDHMQGSFLAANTIYLKDNLENKVHNLSASNYTFTSEVGEFNERFEIVFNSEALSTDEADLNSNKFSIVNLNNNTIQFNTNSNLNIKTVNLFDLLGRQLYHLKGNNSSETYNLPNLKNTVYLAKIELSNGLVITKKAIKK